MNKNYYIIRPDNPETYKITGCFMDDEKKFIFIHIYKNASISLRNVLGMRGKYYEYADVKDCGADTICILRNPIDRIVSAYLYLLRLEDNGFLNQHPTHLTKETHFFKIQDDPVKSFISFIHAIEYRNFYDAVTYPQIDFLRDRGLIIEDIDNIFIQENITEEFEGFKKKYNLDPKLVFPKDNTTDSQTAKKIKDYIENDKLFKEKIIELYREDFDLYNRIFMLKELVKERKRYKQEQYNKDKDLLQKLKKWNEI